MSEYIVDFGTSTYKSNDGLIFAPVEQLREGVVRCRDCRYFRIGTNTDSCGFTDKYAHPNGFCSWGERRDK